MACSGLYPNPHVSGGAVSASGSFQFDDGRIGHFSFGGTLHGGEGFGKFNNGQKFSFIYGASSSDEDRAAMAAALGSLGQVGQNMQQMQQMSAPAYTPSQPIYVPQPIYEQPSPTFLTPSTATHCNSEMRAGIVSTNCN